MRRQPASVYVEAGIAAAASGVYTAYSWLTIDKHIFQAVSQQTHQRVGNFWDLSQHISAKAASMSNFQDKLSGHMSEFTVHDHLIAAHHSASMAHALNNPGWDLKIDGVLPVNVKNYTDATSAIHQHFANYPDIPIVLNADAAHIPPDALNFDPSHGLDLSTLAAHHQVIVDGALSHADSMAAAGHAQNLLIGHWVPDSTGMLPDSIPGDHAITAMGAHVPDGGFPVFTLMISTYREGKLFLRDDTDLLRASKNVGRDVVATGIGAKAGAVTGGQARMFLGPHGAAVGALGGAIVGGISGKLWSSERRLRPLHEAKEHDQLTREAYIETEAEVIRKAEREWTDRQSEIQAGYELTATRIRDAHFDLTGELRSSVHQAVCFERSYAEKVLVYFGAQIDDQVAQAEKRLAQATPSWRGLLKRFLAPQEWVGLRIA